MVLLGLMLHSSDPCSSAVADRASQLGSKSSGAEPQHAAYKEVAMLTSCVTQFHAHTEVAPVSFVAFVAGHPPEERG